MNKKGNILIVNDTNEMLVKMTNLLCQEGYTVFSADNGELTLSSIEKVTPDLILMNVEMHGTDGFDICRKIKANTELLNVPIMFLTLAAEKSDRVKMFKHGAVDYILCPFENEELFTRVKTQIDLYGYYKLFKERTAEQIIIIKNSESRVLKIE